MYYSFLKPDEAMLKVWQKLIQNQLISINRDILEISSSYYIEQNRMRKHLQTNFRSTSS